MPLEIYTGDAADAEMQRRAVSYEAMLSAAARNLIAEHSAGLDAERERLRAEQASVMIAVSQVSADARRLLARAYLLLGACPALAGLVAVLVVIALR